MVNVFDILGKVYGARGLPFPGKVNTDEGKGIAEAFTELRTGEGTAIASGFNTISFPPEVVSSSGGSYIKKYTDEYLGRYEFLPVNLNGYDLPNAILIITGEKEIIETDVIEVGTVFEKTFTRPYDISIITTLINPDDNWPERQIMDVVKLWKKDEVLTLKCALTDMYLQVDKNFILKKISHLDAQGSENVEIIQLDGRSNVDFILELI
jgi:hypothetical protein